MRTTNHFGEELKKRREQAEVSVGELAPKVDISVSHLYTVESGKNAPPSPNIIEKLEHELAVERGLLFKKAIEDGFERIPPVVISAVTKVDRMDKFMEFMEAIANGVQIPWYELLDKVHSCT